MLERDFEQRDSSEHEIRRRPTDRREVIKRIFYCTRISRITRIFYTGFFEHELHESHEYFCTRISRITRILVRSVALAVFEHEIRRRPTDRREVIARIKRIIYCTRISRITRIFLLSAILDYEILRFLMRHIKGHP